MTTPNRLARYNALPKVSRSTESELALRHPEINPEWVIDVIDSLMIHGSKLNRTVNEERF